MNNIPESNRRTFAIAFIVAVIALFAFVAYSKYQEKNNPFGLNSDIMATEPDPSKVFDAPFTKAKLYYTDLEKYGDDLDNKDAIGCGDGFVAYSVPIESGKGDTKSDAIIYVLDRLFTNKVFEDLKKENATQDEAQGVNPYNSLANSKLTLKSVKDVPGEYEVVLTGNIRSGGVCDDPRIVTSITKTIEQIFAPDKVDIYIEKKLLSEYFSEKGE